MSAIIHDAYWLGRQGIPVAPTYAITAAGICSCRAGARCSQPGKHPIGGITVATTDPLEIRRLWRKHPDAGVCMDLERAGLVDIAPDSPEHLADFERRGIPAGAAVYESGGGVGHRHILTRRPEGCPAVRLCRSGEFDIMSAGVAVAPNTPGKVQTYRWLTPDPNLNGGLPDAPAWAVEMLIERAAAIASGKGPAPSGPTDCPPSGDAADEPPIELKGEPLATWRGERPKLTADGTMDRNASLLKLGRVLYDAGMTRRGVAAELRERDHGLGWHKFCCGRKDGERRYAAMAEELARHGRTPIAIFSRDEEPDPGPASAADADETEADHTTCQERISRLRATLAHTRGQLAACRATYDTVLRTAGAEGISPTKRITAIFTANAAATGKAKGKADATGAVTLFVPKIAKLAGLPVSTFSRSLKELGEDGWSEKHVHRVRQMDPKSRQLTDTYVSQLRVVVPGETITEMLTPVAALTSGRVKPGGKRVRRCPDHPHAAIIKRWHTACSECGTVLDEGGSTITIEDEDGDGPQDFHSEDSDEGSAAAETAAAAEGDDPLNLQNDGLSTAGQGTHSDHSGETPPPTVDEPPPEPPGPYRCACGRLARHPVCAVCAPPLADYGRAQFEAERAISDAAAQMRRTA